MQRSDPLSRFVLSDLKTVDNSHQFCMYRLAVAEMYLDEPLLSFHDGKTKAPPNENTVGKKKCPSMDFLFFFFFFKF